MKIGLVLSGGGARGVAHLGVIKALQEMGIGFDQIAGTSAGAIVGALLAQGYSPDESLKLIESSSFVRHLRPTWNRMGLLRLDPIVDLYRKYIPHDSFEGLQIPLHVVAVDLNSGEQVVFEKGELVRPVLASCCLPGIFEPFMINKRQYVDGGVLNNLPVDVIEHKVDCLIGSHCNVLGPRKPITSMRGVIERSLVLAVQSKTKDRFARCSVLIEPPQLAQYTTTDISKARDLFRVGYQYTKSIAADIEKRLQTPPIEIV
ncbi:MULTISPECIES: patatin-like phospholipase family protein [Spirosoma]|uniref:Patatin-like phospholipase family protein n=1 Tax=Spirosoma liriopis TaxID=2937440 RepID=A0ABT0HG05_9BACT|nr:MULTISPECIES: patatin-like phospholipase family protein [Spirosoma]MCK8491097.1 patatin-like phospholipase family protein [Spirosoma liriopis]UHG90479.1 patatin-like phospholipase family protein [Spirosoma oryzicola]